MKLRQLFHLTDDNPSAGFYRLSHRQQFEIDSLFLTADIAVRIRGGSPQKSNIHSRRTVIEIVLSHEIGNIFHEILALFLCQLIQLSPVISGIHKCAQTDFCHHSRHTSADLLKKLHDRSQREHISLHLILFHHPAQLRTYAQIRGYRARDQSLVTPRVFSRIYKISHSRRAQTGYFCRMPLCEETLLHSIHNFIRKTDESVCRKYHHITVLNQLCGFLCTDDFCHNLSFPSLDKVYFFHLLLFSLLTMILCTQYKVNAM